jgi:hypothetical protein
LGAIPTSHDSPPGTNMRSDSRPDPWASNLHQDIEQSERDRISDDHLLGLLTVLRSGETSALKELLRGLRWLVYEFTTDAEQVGPACAALGDALDRLTKPRCKCEVHEAANVLLYLRAEIARSYNDYRREVSTNYFATPASTKSSRKTRAKKLGKDYVPPHEPKREWRDADLIGDDGSTWLDREANPSVPSSMRGNMTTDLIEMMEHVARSPFEQDVLDRRMEGMSIRDIAHDLGVSKYQIKTICDLFKQRATEIQ